MSSVKSKSSSKLASPALRDAKHSATQRKTGHPAQSRAASRSAAAASHPHVTKNAKVLAMLRSPSGATIAAMMKETSWQQHSVRGFLAGVVRRRLKLNLVSDKAKGGRVYRVIDKRSITRKEAVAKGSS